MERELPSMIVFVVVASAVVLATADVRRRDSPSTWLTASAQREELGETSARRRRDLEHSVVSGGQSGGESTRTGRRQHGDSSVSDGSLTTTEAGVTADQWRRRQRSV